jgi:predicted kinase
MDRRPPGFVVVSGPPASGKSTLAAALAREMELPLIAKDTIKDALMAVLPVPDVDAASSVLGRAAVEAMLSVAADSPIGAVLDVDTNGPVVVEDVLARILRAFGSGRDVR